MNNHEDLEPGVTPDPALRRQAMLRVFILTLVLLALPVGMVVWAVRDTMRKPATDEFADLSDVDTASLRATLARVADDEWGPEPSLALDEDSPALPVLEWHIPVEILPRISQLLEAAAKENPGYIVLLQETALPGQPARFMIAEQDWLSTLSPALEELGYNPPNPSPKSTASSFLFLEIHIEKSLKE